MPLWQDQVWIPGNLSTLRTRCCSAASCVLLFGTPWTAARQASLSFTISQSLLTFMSIKSVIPSNHLILCCPLLLLLSVFSSTRAFCNESALGIRWSKYWSFSFSISPAVNIQDWSPCSPGDSLKSSPTSLFKSIYSSAFSFLYGQSLTSIHDYWKNQRFDRTDFVSKVMSQLFKCCLGWTARRSNQSILKEISPGCSLEGMMLKLKLQYFGHLMQRVGHDWGTELNWILLERDFVQ